LQKVGQHDFIWHFPYICVVSIQRRWTTALSIRNPRAERLAREVASESGENITQAVIHALEERLERLRGTHRLPDMVTEIMKISHRCSALPDIDTRPPDEILGYDTNGVPDAWS